MKKSWKVGFWIKLFIPVAVWLVALILVLVSSWSDWAATMIPNFHWSVFLFSLLFLIPYIGFVIKKSDDARKMELQEGNRKFYQSI